MRTQGSLFGLIEKKKKNQLDREGAFSWLY
jgi:hypothetical protein